jgi:membrane associated rhomboid family serine protease
VSDTASNSSNFCYRHPDRQSFVLCQRCGRTICAQCQTQAAVGVHCPECVREARQGAPKRKPAILTAVRRGTRSDAPVVTYSLIALCALVFVLQYLTGGPSRGTVTQDFLYFPFFTESEPWRMVTSLFLHCSFLHIALNMYSLLLFGQILERALGRWRYLTLYLLSGLGGSVGVLLIAPRTPVLGASGAIFGLLGAFFVIQRHLGANSVQLMVVIGLNLVAGFIIPGIAWQAHVGGLVVGALVAWILTRTRQRTQRTGQILLLATVLVALVAITFVGVAWMPARLFG